MSKAGRHTLWLWLALSLCIRPVSAQDATVNLDANSDVDSTSNSEATDSETDANPTTPAGPAPLSAVDVTALPGDDQLEAKGARIGRVDIKVVDVFDPEIPKESGAIYRFANRLHINTRENTVRPQLLFKPGDVYSRHIADETARNLRDRRYLEDASVVPIHYDAQTNTVDLLVRVHDVWTLNPGASYGRSGGENTSGFQIDESNLLGMGKSVSVDRSQEVDRSSWKFAYGDPNFLSSRWELDAKYSKTSDGGAQALTIEHPFYSLATRWSATLDALHETRVDRRFEQGVQVDQYQVKQNTVSVLGGWSTGLRGDPKGAGWVQRWSLGYKIDEQSFAPDPVLGSLVVPDDKHLSYPMIGLSWFQDRYEVTRNRDRIDRTEDLYIGRRFDLSVGYASESFGSDRNAMLLTMKYQDAYSVGERQRLFATIGIDGRHESGRWQGTEYTGQLRYDLRETDKSLFVAILDHAHLENPDDSQQLYLGSDEGMRGYPLRYRSGTGRTVLVMEQRYYTTKQILRLLSIGGAAFVDVGKINGQVQPIVDGKSTFSDVGFGLRFGNIRSSRGDMFHFDLAYPLNATGDARKLQFSITTKATF